MPNLSWTILLLFKGLCLLITVFALSMVVGTHIMSIAASTDIFALLLIARFAAASATGTFSAIGADRAANLRGEFRRLRNGRLWTV